MLRDKAEECGDDSMAAGHIRSGQMLSRDPNQALLGCLSAVICSNASGRRTPKYCFDNVFVSLFYMDLAF